MGAGAGRPVRTREAVRCWKGVSKANLRRRHELHAISNGVKASKGKRGLITGKSLLLGSSVSLQNARSRAAAQSAGTRLDEGRGAGERGSTGASGHLLSTVRKVFLETSPASVQLLPLRAAPSPACFTQKCPAQRAITCSQTERSVQSRAKFHLFF